MSQSKIPEQEIFESTSPEALDLSRIKIGEIISGNVNSLLEATVLAENRVENMEGVKVSLSFVQVPAGKNIIFLISNGENFVRLKGTQKQIDFLTELVSSAYIINKDVAEIYPSFFNKTNSFFKGLTFSSIRDCIKLFSVLEIDVKYDGKKLYIGSIKEVSNQETNTVKTYTHTNSQGETIEVTLKDRGGECLVGQRYFLDHKGGSINITQKMFILLGGVLSNGFISREELLYNGEGYLKEIREVFSQIRLNLVNITSNYSKNDGGYKIEGPEDGKMLEAGKKKSLSKKLLEDGYGVYLEERGAKKTRRVKIEFGDQEIEHIFEYEQYVVFEALVKAYNTKLVGWKINRQRKGEIISELNDFFLHNKIPLWIEAQYRKIITAKGDSTVPSGEYRLTILLKETKK